MAHLGSLSYLRGQGGALQLSRNRPGVFVPLNTNTTHIDQNMKTLNTLKGILLAPATFKNVR